MYIYEYRKNKVKVRVYYDVYDVYNSFIFVL